MIIPITPPVDATNEYHQCSSNDDNSDSTNDGFKDTGKVELIDTKKVPNEWALIELNGELHLPTDLNSLIQVQQELSHPQQQEGLNDGDKTNTNNDEETNSTKQYKDGNIYVELGSIQYSKEGTPVMIIGSHELRGKLETLKQPYLVLKKKRKHKTTQYQTSETQKLSLQEPSNLQNTKKHKKSDDTNTSNDDILVSYEIAGIISKRLLFDSYPKSILR